MTKKQTGKLIKGKVILITGGTGSFGSYFIPEILKFRPKKIIIFSRDEDKQFVLQQELNSKGKYLRFVIGDIREKSSLIKTMKDGVDLAIHAAALKQVPNTEYNVLEAVKTNILGAENTVEACMAVGVKRAIAISTDKAVEPVNVMGMTKAIQERIFTLANKYQGKHKTRFACVRYGNVMGSRGSILVLFKKQMEQGGPFTLTHREMTRFNVTLKEAVDLVYYALANMVGGEIFVPKLRMLRVKDLAEVMVKEIRPKDKRVVEIGVRPGEKLHESLISPMESLKTIENKNHFIVLPQIELPRIKNKYKSALRKKERIFRYSSIQGPFLTKSEIKKLLKEEGII